MHWDSRPGDLSDVTDESGPDLHLAECFFEDELMKMQDPDNSFLLRAGTVCEATSSFLNWHEDDTGKDKRKEKKCMLEEKHLFLQYYFISISAIYS